MTDIERRTFTGEIRAASEDGMTFNGYAARYGERTYIGPAKQGFYEEIASGAFAKAIKGADIRCLFNHEPDNLLGRTKSGTLRLKEDATGLDVANDLPPTVLGQTISALVKRGDLTGQSFSFTVAPGGDAWSVVPGGHAQLRTINEFDAIYDVGPVTFPAYDTTSASVRMQSMRGAMRAERTGGKGESRGDMGLAAMVQATDAAVDAAVDALAGGNACQAVCLLNAAALTIDEAQWALYWLDPSLLGALGLGAVPSLIAVVDAAIEAALAACQADTTDPAALEGASSASDALLAALRLPDADDMATAQEEMPPNDDSMIRSAHSIRVRMLAVSTALINN